MSVTNDPNYREGQPVFGPTDAVRPTGETGARCPWCGSEMQAHVIGHDYADEQRHYASCPKCGSSGPHADSPKAALDAASRNEQLGPRMPWSEMSGSEKEAVYNNAARPRPDFPAGAPGPWKESGHYSIVDANGITISFAQQAGYTRPDRTEVRDFILSRVNAPARPAAVSDLGCVVRMPDAEEKRDIFNRAQESGEDYLPQIILETLRWIARSPDACASHVTRPAAAGLRLAPEQIEECLSAGLKVLTGARYYDTITRLDEDAMRATLAHAESILSSRATGAEADPLTALEQALGNLEGVEIPFNAHGAIRELRGWLTRRHATIRGGGE